MPPRLSRLLGSLGAMWTLIASVSPVPLHRCPSSHASPSRFADAGRDGAMARAMLMPHAGHHEMAMPSSRLASSGATHDAPGAPSDKDCPCCQCLGCCCATASVVLPGLGPLVPTSTDVVVDVAEYAVSAHLPLERQPYVLPFAIGPPI